MQHGSKLRDRISGKPSSLSCALIAGRALTARAAAQALVAQAAARLEVVEAS
jgi:hypothetical protein